MNLLTVGWFNLLKPDSVLVRNATLWTSGERGVLKKTRPFGCKRQNKADRPQTEGE